MSTVFEQCSANSSADYESILKCISDHFESASHHNVSDVESWLLVICGSLIFFMQVGFAMLCAGCVRKKNVWNTMLKNLLDACGAAIGFYAIGFALAFGGQNETVGVTFVGTKDFFLIGDDVDLAFWFFEYAFSATAVTIVAGTIAERSRMTAYLVYSLLLTSFVYPVTAHAIWSNNGFLSAFSAEPFRGVGVIDFAGSGVVHLTGGTAALCATFILGARQGRFHDRDGTFLSTPRKIKGHSTALQLLGTFVLWFGWYGFNPGSALVLTTEFKSEVASLAAVNTSISAATGALSAMLTNLYLVERETGQISYDLTMAMNGALSGLVAITSGCGTVYPWAALCVGLVAGWIYLGGSALLVKLKIDDAVDAIPVHMFCGTWGLIAAGIFSAPGPMLSAFGSDEHMGLFYSIGQGSFDGTLFSNQILAILFIAGWSGGTMLPFFSWLNYKGWFRVDVVEELVGLDVSCHGGVPEEEENAEFIIDTKEKKKSKRKETSVSIPSDSVQSANGGANNGGLS